MGRDEVAETKRKNERKQPFLQYVTPSLSRKKRKETRKQPFFPHVTPALSRKKRENTAISPICDAISQPKKKKTNHFSHMWRHLSPHVLNPISRINSLFSFVFWR